MLNNILQRILIDQRVWLDIYPKCAQNANKHVFAGERLQAFSDAVFSIIVTFMVVPLTSSVENVISDDTSEDFVLYRNLISRALIIKYLVYLFSYVMVLDYWFIHVSIFSIIEQVDGVILTLNLLCLLFISFLPFTNVLISEYAVNYERGTSEQYAVYLCSADIAVVGLVMVIMLLYGFRRQRLLHPEVVKNKEIRTIKIASVIAMLVKPLIAIITIILSYAVHQPLPSVIIFYSSAIVVLAVRLIFYFYFKKYKKTIDRLPRHLFKTIASKFRIEFFSDGIFAIVATLIVLDITTTSGLTGSDNEKLSERLKKSQYVFLSYIISFTLVGLLWLVHYQMLHFIKKLTPTLTVINFVILFLVGGIPFASKLDANISSKEYEHQLNNNSKQTSVAVLSTLVFLISLTEMILWRVAIYSKKKCMSTEVERYQSEALQLCKVLVLPTISLLNYCCSYSQVFIDNHLEAVFFFSAPIIYLLLDAMFRMYGRCKQKWRLKAANKKQNRFTATNSSTVNTSNEVQPRRNHDPYVYKQRPRSYALKVQIADNSCTSSAPPGSYRCETEDELDLVLGRGNVESDTESDSN